MKDKIVEILQRVIAESNRKARCSHPLWKEHCETIIQEFDFLFPKLIHISPAQKMSGLLRELTKEKPIDNVECRICNKYHAKNLTIHLRNVHNITVEEYKKQYSSEVFSDSLRCVFSDKFKGDKNPAYNHGGRLSPMSDKFVGYEGLSVEEREDEKKKVCETIRLSNKHNGNNNTTLKYWLSRGYSLEEAQEEISKRQETFSFDKCVEKHGEEIGNSIFIDRQIRWQTTMNNKPIDEVLRINKERGTDKNGVPHVGGYFNETRIIRHNLQDVKCVLYYVNIYDENDISFWKIGISMNGAIKRLLGSVRRSGLKMKILFEKWSTVMDAFTQEQQILRDFREHRIAVNYNGFTTTEAFSKNILNETI